MRRKTMQVWMLDEPDRKILGILAKNGRATYTDIAEQVGLSRVAVKRRMDNMESAGVIRGYAVVVDWNKIDRGRL